MTSKLLVPELWYEVARFSSLSDIENLRKTSHELRDILQDWRRIYFVKYSSLPDWVRVYFKKYPSIWKALQSDQNRMNARQCYRWLQWIESIEEGKLEEHFLSWARPYVSGPHARDAEALLAHEAAASEHSVMLKLLNCMMSYSRVYISSKIEELLAHGPIDGPIMILDIVDSMLYRSHLDPTANDNDALKKVRNRSRIEAAAVAVIEYIEDC